MSKKERIYYIDVLNVISALSVVFLHVNGCFWSFSGEESLSWWKSANIIESVFYYAVPVFFMISGATLLDYNQKYGLKEYIKKRVTKTVIPYVVWSLIGLGISIATGNVNLEDVGIKYIVKGIVECSFVKIYWFFVPLFCLYLSIPLIAAVEQDKKISTYTYCAVTALIVNIIIPFMNNVFQLEIGWGYQIAVASGYLFYLFTGYLLSHVEIKKSYRFILYVFSIAGLMTHIIGTYVLTNREGTIIQIYKGYNNLPCVIYSLGIFVFIKYISKGFSEKVNKVFSILSGYTFGVYLIHIFIIRGIEKYSGIPNTNLIYRLVVPFIVFAIAAGISWCIKKIPLIKYIVP